MPCIQIQLIMFIYILLALLCSASSLRLRESHDYWFLKGHPTSAGDRDWSYCDLRCLYLEHYYPEKDFVVIVLTAPLHDTFATCYVKNNDGYTIWNKVANNAFYEENCGGDYKDWVGTKEFTIKGVYGEGIGTEIPENATFV